MDFQLVNDAIVSLPSLLPYATEKELRQLEKDLALLSPGSFAQIASRDGGCRPATSSTLIGRSRSRSNEAATGELEGLVVSMPPSTARANCAANTCRLGTWAAIPIGA